MKRYQRYSGHAGWNTAKVSLTLVLVVAFISAVFLPILQSKAFAYGQLATRSIEMSDSTENATGVSYQVQFTTTSSAQSIVVDFCLESPLYTDTCSNVPGLSTSSAGLTTGTGTTGWNITDGTDHVDVHGAAATGTVSFTLTNITNPNTIGTFYARIYDYTASPDDYVSPTSPGTVADFGGIALTTVANVAVTARVQEELTFCVAGAAITSGCGNASTNPPNLTIGHGSPTLILDSSVVDTATAFMQTSTNAQNGVAVLMKNSNPCGGLSDDGGTTCNIPPANTPFILADNGANTGNADFGMDIAVNSDGQGTMSPTTPYSTAGTYAMAYTGAGTGVTSTFGSQIASSTTVVSNVDNTLTFAATAANTTAAGIYTANMVLIATGTF